MLYNIKTLWNERLKVQLNQQFKSLVLKLCGEKKELSEWDNASMLL